MTLFLLFTAFAYLVVSINQIPLKIGTFYGIIISFRLQNGLGFHLDLDLLKILHGLGFGFEILNGFGYGHGLKII